MHRINALARMATFYYLVICPTCARKSRGYMESLWTHPTPTVSRLHNVLDNAQF